MLVLTWGIYMVIHLIIVIYIRVSLIKIAYENLRVNCNFFFGEFSCNFIIGIIDMTTII